MKQSITIFLIILFSNCFSQSVTTDFEGDRITTDPFGYYYEISDIEIKKYNQSAELQYTYSNNLLGEIASVDASNPLKMLVYFKDFTKVLILDNTLSPASDIIDLTTLDLEETSLACRSYNDGIWYYNPVRFELTRKDIDLLTTNTSNNISILLNKNIQPNFLVEYNNRIYLNDPKNGILVFDVYGTYLKTIAVFGLTEFQVKEKYLIYVSEDGKVEKYDFFSLETLNYEVNKQSPVTDVRIEGEYIYLITKTNRLFIDKIKR